MNEKQLKNYLYLASAFCALCLAVLALVIAFNQVKGAKRSANFITIEGTGFVNTPPNIALINVNIRNQAKKTEDAQLIVKDKAQKILAALADLSVLPEDIKTESYNTAPKYDYPIIPACLRAPCPPQPKPVLVGYEVSQMVTIKLRDIEKVGALFEVLGKLEISEFSGPNFIVDDLGRSKEQARTKAIADAKIKAQKLSKELGVKLLGITSFSEQSDGFQPRAYLMKGDIAASSASGISAGENKIISNVTITYEIE